MRLYILYEAMTSSLSFSHALLLSMSVVDVDEALGHSHFHRCDFDGSKVQTLPTLNVLFS